MGNTQTANTKQNKKSIIISHPVFENAKTIKNQFGKEMIEIGISMKSEKDFVDWEKNYKRTNKITSLFNPEEVKYQDKGCCGSSGIAHILYQKYPYVLAQQIGLRRNNNQGHFQQSQLWLLLYTLVSAGQLFYGIRKTKIGDIRPQNIFLNSQGQMKVASQYSFPYGQTNYQKTLMSRQIVTYLAPQQVKDIQFGKMKDTNDPATVQTFSMGLTMLDAALLSSSEKFYSNNGVFSYDKLNQSIKLLNHIGYGPQLTNLIIKMCQPKSSDRIKSPQILKLLRPFENQILSKKPFRLDNLPRSKQYQNPQHSILDISSIQIKKYPRQAGQYKIIQGVVFDGKDDTLMLSSLNHSKQIVVKTSKLPNSYKVNQQQQKNTFTTPPVQTTIHYPPITIAIAQPAEQDYIPPQNQHNQHNQNTNQNM